MKRFTAERRIDLFSEEESPLPLSPLFHEAGGQMFGVLVCRDSRGREIILRAFSGQFCGRWEIGGWVPPLADPEEYRAILHRGAGEIKDLTREIDAAREIIRKTSAAAPEERVSPAGESKGEFRRRFRNLKERRTEISRRLMEEIFDLYRLKNFAGEERPLRDVFGWYTPDGIPTGTGDCCLPKLLNAAVRRGLRPVDAAEFYWGRGNRAGTRQHGRFYPPCAEKCEPILGYLCRGLDDTVRQRLLGGASSGSGLSPDPGRSLDILYADEHILVINKPSGLLSVRGRGPGGRDSVASRIRALYPSSPAQPAVHRLDMDTSGVMVYALDARAHRNLSIQFQRRRVEKEYLALLDGPVSGSSGEIRLSFRPDAEHRPYQILDPESGKEGITGWEVLGRTEEGKSLVLFHPRTGRTHQLRLHSSHSLGLGVPICGDNLYGRGLPGKYLCLHAWKLSFTHPVTGKKLIFRTQAPFWTELSLNSPSSGRKMSEFTYFLP